MILDEAVRVCNEAQQGIDESKQLLGVVVEFMRAQEFELQAQAMLINGRATESDWWMAYKQGHDDAIREFDN